MAYQSKYTGAEIDRRLGEVDTIPLVVDEVLNLPRTHDDIVVGYMNSIDLDSLNKTPQANERFWGVCKTSDKYIYSFVAKCTGEITEENGVKYAVFEFTEVVLLHDGSLDELKDKHLQAVTDISVIYKNVDNLPVTAGDGTTVIVKTNGGTPLMLYAYNDNKWAYKCDVRSQTLYLDLKTNTLYRYTMGDPYLLPVNEQPHLYEHYIEYEANGYRFNFTIRNNSATEITNFSMLVDRIPQQGNNRWYYIPAAGLFDGYPVIEVGIGVEEYAFVTVIESNELSEYDLSYTRTLTDKVTQIF